MSDSATPFARTVGPGHWCQLCAAEGRRKRCEQFEEGDWTVDICPVCDNR